MKLRISNPFHARLATLALVLAAPHAHAATDLWTGATSGVWDTSVTNWSNGGTNQYTDGDIVQFGDTGGANLGITISSAVSPASVTFTDTGAGTNAYTFGTSSINGTGTTVTLDSGFGGSVQFGVANGYTGGTTLNGGTLTVGNATSLGTGTVTLNGGTFNNSANVTMTNAINVAGTTAVYAIAATTLTLSTSITGSGTLNTGGANSGSTLTISGNLSGFTGTITHDNVVGKGNTFFANLNTAAKFSTSGNTTSQEMRFQGTSKIGELSGTGGRVGIRAGTLTVNQSTNTTYAGNIVEISNSSSLIKSGAGTLTLSGTNTYAGNGTTTVSGGTLLTTKVAALPGYNSSGKVIINGGSLGVRMGDGTTGWTTGEVDTLLTNATKTNGALGIDTTNGNLTQWTAFTTTNLGSTLGLTKLGSNTLTLDQANSYSGATTVNGGKLTVASAGTINSTSGVSIGAGEFNYNSSTALTQAVSFAAGSTGGKLSGTGAINLGLNITAGNTLAIGNGNIGAMAFGNNLEVGGTYLHELFGGGSTADLGDVTGNLTLGGILDLVQLGTYTVGNKFTLFAYDGTLTGLFKDSGGVTSILDDTNFTDAGGIWQLNYNDTTAGLNGGVSASNTYVTITAVPEPNVAALIGGLGTILLLRRRR